MEGLGTGDERFAEDHAAIHLARPLNPADVLVAEPSVELDKVRCLFRSVHGKFDKPRVPCPLLRALKQHAADARALMLRVNGELVDGRNAVACEVRAVVFRVRRLGNDSSDQLSPVRDHKAIAAANSLGCDLGCLINGGLVQPHGTETCVRAMQQRSELDD